MEGAQSVSFTSFDSYNYPSHNNLTFHEIEPTSSRFNLPKDSMISHFPGSEVPLGKFPELVLVLQAAEIERLTLTLQEYRSR